MAVPSLGEGYDELIRRVAVILGVAAIAAVSVWIMAPFLPAILWAGTIAVATWPVLLQLQALLGGRRWAATTVLTLVLAVGFFIPLLMVVGMIAQHAGDAAELARDLSSKGLPPAPAWLEALPVVGHRAAAEWTAVAALDAAAVQERLEPGLKLATRWLLGSAGSLLRLVLQVILAMAITALMYANGERVAAGLRAFFRRLGGPAAEALVPLAASSARGVALGVVVTAALQALLTGIALAFAGVPGAALLGGLALVLCLAQIGPLLILVAAVGWLYWTHQVTAAIVLGIVSLGLISMDNVIKPILITRGAKLPLLLVFVGVIGGMLSFGLIGIFIGPVVLAVCWTLLQSWVGEVSVVEHSQS
jgi:predicted PurR-regulated permease PerM